MGHTTNKVGGASSLSPRIPKSGLVKAYNRFCERNRGKEILEGRSGDLARVRGALDPD